MEQDYRLAEGEYRFACLVWANEPLGSGQLVALANEALGWKKSTTYTVLKKLCERGILHNANGTVTALVKQGSWSMPGRKASRAPLRSTVSLPRRFRSSDRKTLSTSSEIVLPSSRVKSIRGMASYSFSRTSAFTVPASL